MQGFVEAVGVPDLFFGAVEFPMASMDDAVMVWTEDHYVVEIVVVGLSEGLDVMSIYDGVVSIR